jgi:O-antigen ligase
VHLRLPVLAFVFWTLLAIALSTNPETSLSQVRKLLLFSVVLLVASAFRKRSQIWHTVQGVFLIATLSALYGLGQFAWRFYDLHRQGLSFYEHYVTHQSTGFMSHWMTFGGLAMLSLLLLVSTLLFDGNSKKYFYGWASLAIIGLSLLAAFTRGIWLGTLAGLVYLVACYRRWMLLLLPTGVLLLYVIAPPWLQHRAQSIFHPAEESSTLSRFVMMRTGLRMIVDHPWFGVGPNQVESLFLDYTPADAVLPPAWYGHLHNTFLQIAAERGLPCLAILLWFFVAVIRDGFFRTRSLEVRERAFGHSAIAATAGIMVSGLFEYNLGDSEVLMLYLVVISIPYAWHRLPREEAQPGKSDDAP